MNTYGAYTDIILRRAMAEVHLGSAEHKESS